MASLSHRLLVGLPRWAILAVAVRSLRRIQDKLDKLYFWADPSPEIAFVLSKTEQMAAGRHDVAPTREDIRKLQSVVLSKDSEAYRLRQLASRLGHLARAARGRHTKYVLLAAELLDEAIECFNQQQLRDKHYLAIRQDLELVRECARNEHWTHSTPVSQHFFGALWPAPESTESDFAAGDEELVIELQVPAGVSLAELKRRALEAATLCDDLHRAYGGHGLQVSQIEILHDARVPVPETV